MIAPPPLQAGDTVAFASPARSIEPHQLDDAAALFERHGFRLRLDPEIFAVHHQFGGNDAHRAAHFNRLLSDPQVKAIVAARGGFGCNRTTDGVDFELLRKNPKWIVGYSDITHFHALIGQKTGLQSLHAPMGKEMGNITAQSEEAMINALTGRFPNYRFITHPLNREGAASGILIGGNLSVLYSLAASGMFPETNGRILFIEDVDEYLYHIDRMMISLKKAGIFSQIAGLVVGAFTDIHDHQVPFGLSIEEIIREHCADFDFPIAFGFEAGHQPQNLCLVMGRQTHLEVEPENDSVLNQAS